MSAQLLNANGEPIQHANGHARKELVEYFARQWNERVERSRTERRVKAAYDAASDSTEYSRYWANADSRDGNEANSLAVRRRLRSRQRYEGESNAQYDGILKTYCDMVVGVGPKLRMLTRNRTFNQTVEREWQLWCNRIQYRRKLWCACHGKVGDGESFLILGNNPSIEGEVQLDLLPIECDQFSTPFLPAGERGYIDGIRYDPDTGNILWYDFLPDHPGSAWTLGNMEAIRLDPANVLHWFTLKRAGTVRGVPDLASSLNVGAAFRRWREATLAKAETQADFTVFLKSLFPPETQDPVQPMSTLDIEKRMMVALPNSVDPVQLENNTPGAQFGEFHRSLVSEQARPLSMPYNAAACDSSTYSFASGKLDTLCFRAGIDVERADCDLLVNDRVFAAWFREWTILTARREIPPFHSWQWPPHPVIDDVADSNSKQTQLQTGQISHRQVHAEKGEDYEDVLSTMAEDWFGEASDENVDKCRKINLLRVTNKDAMPYVAQMLGLEVPQATPTGANRNAPTQSADDETADDEA